jgi:4-hydroxy-tetrahydrodipicolinate synthase
VWSGIELLCLPLLALGGIGFVSAVTNLAPRAVAQMYEYWVDGRFSEALDIHYALHPTRRLDVRRDQPGAHQVRALTRRPHRIADGVRPPLVTPSPSGAQRIDQLLVTGAPMLEGRLADLAAAIVNTQ